MTVKEAAIYLKKRGIDLTIQGIREIDKHHGLREDGNESHRGRTPSVDLDPQKVKQLADVHLSDAAVAKIVEETNVSYSRVYYYINKQRINTVKIYGRLLIKSKKDAEHVRNYFKNLSGLPEN